MSGYIFQYLCRAGMEAVQTTFELEVISTEYPEDPNLSRGEAGQAGGVKPANVHSCLRGKLHLRIANIGHPVDPKALATGMNFCKPDNSLNHLNTVGTPFTQGYARQAKLAKNG